MQFVDSTIKISYLNNIESCFDFCLHIYFNYMYTKIYLIDYFQAKLSLEVSRRWREGDITLIGNHTPPHEPPRHSQLTVVAPGKIKSPGKGVSKVRNLLRAVPVKHITHLGTAI